LAATGVAILSAPISSHDLVITIVGYLANARTVVTTVSQALVSDNETETEKMTSNDIQVRLCVVGVKLLPTTLNISLHD